MRDEEDACTKSESLNSFTSSNSSTGTGKVVVFFVNIFGNFFSDLLFDALKILLIFVGKGFFGTNRRNIESKSFVATLVFGRVGDEIFTFFIGKVDTNSGFGDGVKNRLAPTFTFCAQSLFDVRGKIRGFFGGVKGVANSLFVASSSATRVFGTVTFVIHAISDVS